MKLKNVVCVTVPEKIENLGKAYEILGMFIWSDSFIHLFQLHYVVNQFEFNEFMQLNILKMEVYDNAKTYSKSSSTGKPKFRRREHVEKSEKIVQQLFAKEIEEEKREMEKKMRSKRQVRD